MDAPQVPLTKGGLPDKSRRSSKGSATSARSSAGRPASKARKEQTLPPKRKWVQSARSLASASVSPDTVVSSSSHAGASVEALIAPLPAMVPKTQAASKCNFYLRKDYHPTHVDECAKMWRDHTGGVLTRDPAFEAESRRTRVSEVDQLRNMLKKR
jgi:hypothetical protein